jgi:hypothetical protein
MGCRTQGRGSGKIEAKGRGSGKIEANHFLIDDNYR